MLETIDKIGFWVCIILAAGGFFVMMPIIAMVLFGSMSEDDESSEYDKPEYRGRSDA